MIIINRKIFSVMTRTAVKPPRNDSAAGSEAAPRAEKGGKRHIARLLAGGPPVLTIRGTKKNG